MREEYTKRLRGNATSEGFSLIEIIAVLAIVLFLAGVAFPIFTKISYNIRLKSAATNLSGLMQQARILAARKNTVYTILIPSGGGKACINLNPNTSTTCDPGEPVITFNANITPASAAPSGSPSAYVLVGDSSPGTAYDNATTLGYSARGLPCAYSGGTCSTPAASYFVYYLRDTRPDGSIGWAAVVVTRAGRTKSVTWNGASWN